MQEEIEHKTVNLAISTTKLSARTLLRGMQFLLRQYDKHASQGKQSMKRLVRQNRGVTNVEIQKTGIKDFDRYAKRYHIDYSIQKDLSCTPPRYLIYFKARQMSELNRRERVHRLCTRAGMLESFLVCPGELTDDQVMELLKISFRQPEVVLALAKMVHDVHERSNVQNPLE